MSGDEDMFAFLTEAQAEAAVHASHAEPTFDPAREGVDHINAYSKSRTKIGRMLSNFARTPYTCGDGAFASIEAYWYWLLCAGHPERESLRGLHGYQAKKAGRQMAEDTRWSEIEGFQGKICAAVEAKVRQNPEVAEALARSTLPIIHYYVTPQGKVVRTTGDGWVWAFMESLRSRLQGEQAGRG